MALTEAEKKIKQSVAKLNKARERERQLWEEHKKVLKDGSREGLTCQRMGDLTGISKARVWQLVNDHVKASNRFASEGSR